MTWPKLYFVSKLLKSENQELQQGTLTSPVICQTHEMTCLSASVLSLRRQVGGSGLEGGMFYFAHRFQDISWLYCFSVWTKQGHHGGRVWLRSASTRHWAGGALLKGTPPVACCFQRVSNPGSLSTVHSPWADPLVSVAPSVETQLSTQESLRHTRFQPSHVWCFLWVLLKKTQTCLQ